MKAPTTAQRTVSKRWRAKSTHVRLLEAAASYPQNYPEQEKLTAERRALSRERRHRPGHPQPRSHRASTGVTQLRPTAIQQTQPDPNRGVT
jgi:hypothetical protein